MTGIFHTITIYKLTIHNSVGNIRHHRHTCHYIGGQLELVDSLWPNNAIVPYRYVSTLAQVVAYSWQHETITWTNVDLSLVRSIDIHLRVISQEIPQPLITKICLKTSSKFNSILPGVNDSTHCLFIIPYGIIEQCWVSSSPKISQTVWKLQV